MPTYAYRCQNCGVEFERVQKFSDAPVSRCPECRGKVNRIPQASAVVFKGSGWYITDSKKSASVTTPASKKADDTSPSTAATTDKSDTSATPAASTETKPEKKTSKKSAPAE